MDNTGSTTRTTRTTSPSLRMAVNKANAAAGTPSSTADTADFQRALEGLASRGDAEAAKVAEWSDRAFSRFVRECRATDWRNA